MTVMRTVALIVALVWAAFWLYWFVAAFSMKRGRVPWGRELGICVVVALVVLVLVKLGAFRDDGLQPHLWRGLLGLALVIAGLSFAVWARRHIGRNWGMPMTQKTEPDLVTTGPYRLVRHPIYSGILLAAAGTTVAVNWIWMIVVLVTGAYFVYSASVEERFMTAQFPDSYPTYAAATKMLVPFIL